MFYLCHAYVSGEGFFIGRQPILQEMEVTPEHWIRFKGGDLAKASQPMPFAGCTQAPFTGFEDDFQSNRLRVEWTWNYPYANVDAALKQGKLYLSGTPKEGIRQGSALCIRAQMPDYSCETRVLNQGKSLKGLTLYGDDGNMIIWGVSDGKLLLKLVKDGQETPLYETGISTPTPYLRFTLAHGAYLHFYYSDNGQDWKSIRPTPLDAKTLLRWDRVQRPGLFHAGDNDAPGIFDYFRLTNISESELNP